MTFLRQSSLRGIIPLFLLIPILLGAFSFELKAQQDPATLDPADIFFQAWLEIKRAEKHENKGAFDESWQKYRQAFNYYNVLHEFHKNWKPNLVQSRIASTEESMKKLEPKATAELLNNSKKTEDLIEGPLLDSSAGSAAGSGFHSTSSTRNKSKTGLTTIDPSTAARLQKLEQENKGLKRKLEAVTKKVAASNAQGTETKLDETERKRLNELIAKKDREIAMIRDVLARAPLQQDMNRISRANQTLEQEIKITARALQSSQQKLVEATQAAENSRRDAELSENRSKEILKSMQQQGDINNGVIRGLRDELKTVTRMLEQTRNELGTANSRIDKMQLSLNQSQETIKELTKQRDQLRIERDTLANTLKLSDSKGVQGLITENMRLGTELKEALDRLGFLEDNQNTTKDELIRARNDLTMAKNRILKYQKEQATQNKTIKSLETQLKDAQAALSSTKANNGQYSNEEELKTLRGTVKRLLTAQERRRLGTQILWDAYQKSKVKIDGFSKAIDDIRKIKINLTDEEKEFITAHRSPDGEFKNPERVSVAHARTHGDALQSETSYVEGLIIRHIEKGRTRAAHSVLIDINERVPGNYGILCKLGVVEMKLGHYDKAVDCLDEAITMRENSGYAHFMKGIAQYKNKDLKDAQRTFERSLILKPDNARAHLYLGNLAGAAKRYQQAEEHFLSTIKINPSLADAYYNLSVLYLQQKRKQDALSYYQKALNNGAQPDQALENKLKG
jgi:Flp pilus assembly protein TadD